MATLARLRAVPKDAVPYNPRLQPPVLDKAGLTKWLDRHYPGPIAIKREDLPEFVMAPFGHGGAYFLGLLSLTEPAMYAKHRETGIPNPFVGRALKRAYNLVQSGNWSYRNAVNNARIRIEDANDGPIFLPDGSVRPPMTPDGEIKEFQPSPRQWGTRIRGTPLITHNDHLYLECRPIRTIGIQYFVDGKEVHESVVHNFLKNPDVEQQAAHQGLTIDATIPVRDPRLDHVEMIRYLRDLYII